MFHWTPFNFADADPEYRLGFARQQAHVLNSRAYEIEYPEMPINQLVTIDTSIPEWAGGIDTLFGDKVGEAKWLTGFAKDVPLADASMGMVSITIKGFGIGYQWNVEELGKAAFQGYPLTDRRAAAARFAAETFQWGVFLRGDTVAGMTGLINHSTVSPVALPNDGTAGARAWVDNAGVGQKTSDQIVRDLNTMLIGDPGPQRVIKNTILLPDRALDYIVKTPYGVTNPGETIMSFYMKNNEYKRQTGRDITIRSLWDLRNAATGGLAGQGRAVAYLNSPDVLKFWVPMPFRFWPVYQDGPFNFMVPGMSRVAPLDVFKPAGIYYADGVTLAP